MNERTILVIAAFVATAAVLIAVDTLIAIYTDMRPRPARRTEPWGAR